VRQPAGRGRVRPVPHQGRDVLHTGVRPRAEAARIPSARQSQEEGAAMRGSTRRRGKTWTALWDAVDAETGKRQQKSKGGFKSQREAQQHLSSVLVRVAEGTYSEPSKQALGAFLLQEWMPAVSGQLRPLSRDRYTAIIDTYVVGRPIAGVPL